jgi:hypothetical protein
LGLPFDWVSWDAGYRHGYRDGRHDGEELGAQSTHDHYLRKITLWGADLRLDLHDVHTPSETLHAITLLLEERRRE